MILLILTVCLVFAILVASELWWRVKKPNDELSRKFIHITVGSFAAFWPYFLTWNQILFLSLAFVVVVGASQYFGIFKAIHAVERPTWGEVCFAVAVGTLAFVTKDAAIYTAALLHMGLADGLAAIVGTSKLGNSNGYMLLGHRKSIAGSVTFFLVSLTILIGFATVSPVLLSPILLLGIAAVATAIENVGLRGVDNLLVPLWIAAALSVLT